MSRFRALATAVPMLLIAATSLARADEAAELPPRDEVTKAPAQPPFRWFALELNPLATILGRYSFNAELMTGQHIAIVLSPFIRYATSNLPSLDAQPDVSAGGTEIGVRYYSGKKGPNGFFIGPSLVIESVSCRSFSSSGCNNGQVVSFDGSFPSEQVRTQAHLGFATDVGGQWMSDGGFIVSAAGGVGTIYDFPSFGSTFFPRMLFSIGQAL